MASKKSVEETYDKKNLHEHVLLRPDTYIGSIEPCSEKMWVYDESSNKIVEKVITFTPGLYKIFDEVLVNAADHSKNYPNECNAFDFTFNKETGVICVRNNGPGIAVVEHSKHKMYIPTMIFGHLLTGSNFNDNEERTTGGRNGFGAKLTNIYSTEFTVETVDAENQKKFTQTWKNNMYDVGKKSIKTSKVKPYTQITFTPDYAKFNLEGLSDDIISLFTKRAYDMAGLCKGSTVTINGKKVKFNSFKQYIALYQFTPESEGMFEAQEFSKLICDDSDVWDVGVIFAPDQSYKCISFVNSICTYKGGTHESLVTDAIVAHIKKDIEKKNKNVKIKNPTIKDNLIVFINSTVVNPRFDGQCKETLTTTKAQFKVKYKPSDKFLSAILKTGISKHIIDGVNRKDEKKMATMGSKTVNGLLSIHKLEDAKYAGTAKSLECALIVTEGDSAKALAMAGLSMVDAKFFGVFPLKGKFVNVRENAGKAGELEKIKKNAEASNLIKILNLKWKQNYNDPNVLKTLRYGRIIIMTDQDTDGFHIKGLIMNFIDVVAPTLLDRKGFVTSLITPVIKASKGKDLRVFYNLVDYASWKETATGAWRIKYYKGLGTSTKEEAKEYFNNIQELLRYYTNEEIENKDEANAKDEQIYKSDAWKKLKVKEDDFNEDDDINSDDDQTLSSSSVQSSSIRRITTFSNPNTEALTLGFHQKRADHRKIWLRNPNVDTIDNDQKDITVPEFINKELILHSKENTARMVSSLDGLKNVQRKIIDDMIESNITSEKNEMKVSQLAAHIAQHKYYHHGEASMVDAIVKMAQNYFGSNNINLLVPSGQFGSRLCNGDDKASARYIHSYLSSITTLIYKKEDNPVLDYVYEDGAKAEPKMFAPIVPMVLVNGNIGIATGYGAIVPKYNIKDIIAIIRAKLTNKTPNYDICPYFRGSKYGSVLKDTSKNTECYISYGKYEVDEETDNVIIRVTELPCGRNQYSYEKYKIMLQEKLEKKLILTYSCDLVSEPPVFTVVFTPEMAENVTKKDGHFYKFLSLSININLNNMYIFDENGFIRKFRNPREVIDMYYNYRIIVYTRRKLYLIDKYERELDILKWKMQFITDVISKKIKVFKEQKKNIIKKLIELQYPPLSQAHEGYEYLLTISIYKFTQDEIDELQKQLDNKEEELEKIRSTTEEQQWLHELNELDEAYDQWLIEEEEKEQMVPKKTSKKSRKKKA